MNTKKGFTLIELLTVTAILTLLMSMVFFKVTEAKKKGEDAHMKAEATQVERAVMAYKEDNDGMVPGHKGITVTGPGFETYVEGDPITGDEYTAAMQDLVTGKYLSEIPTSPAGGDYSYIISADGDEAVFAVNLNYEDRSSGGSGGSGSRNSCELVENITPVEIPPQYPDDINSYGFLGCREVQAASCPNPGQTDDTYSCFIVTAADITQNCGCDWSVYSNDPGKFPESICQSHIAMDPIFDDDGNIYFAPFTCQYFPPNPVKYYSCEHDFIPPLEIEDSDVPTQPNICSGAEPTDYCTCM